MNPYKENHIKSLTPVDALILFLDELLIATKSYLYDINPEENISKTINIVATLSSTLDRDSDLEWIPQMSDLYQFIIIELTSRDKYRIEKIIPVIENIRQTWKEAKDIINGTR